MKSLFLGTTLSRLNFKIQANVFIVRFSKPLETISLPARLHRRICWI